MPYTRTHTYIHTYTKKPPGEKIETIGLGEEGWEEDKRSFSFSNLCFYRVPIVESRKRKKALADLISKGLHIFILYIINIFPESFQLFTGFIWVVWVRMESKTFLFIKVPIKNIKNHRFVKSFLSILSLLLLFGLMFMLYPVYSPLFSSVLAGRPVQDSKAVPVYWLARARCAQIWGGIHWFHRPGA